MFYSKFDRGKGIHLPFFKDFRRSFAFSVVTALFSGMMASAIANPLPAEPSMQPNNLVAAVDATLADGVYLYGESPKTGVIGKEYLIFRVQDNHVQGAFFMPRSEFACASGQIAAQKLSLMVSDPYGESPATPIDIAFVPRTPVAKNAPEIAITLEGLQPIQTISSAETELLRQCLP